MPADDPHHELRGLAAFTTYADGTPRDPEADEPARHAWDEPTFVDPGGPLTPAPRRRAWPMVAMGAAILTAFGAGFLASRTGAPESLDSGPAAVVAVRPAASQPMNVEVSEATPLAPPPPPAYGAKLEVLPADMPAPRTDAGRPPREPRVLDIGPRQAPSPEPLPLPLPLPREVAQAPVARDASATATATPSFDCGDAPTLAREMVCRDIGLAALDRRMKRAYAAAVAAGAPESELRADQDDWLDVREEAARISRRSVVNIYRQRIDELQGMADRSWP